MVVLRIGDFVCGSEKTCLRRKSEYPYGCDLNIECPIYLAELSSLFKCEVCSTLIEDSKPLNTVFYHTLPSFKLCYKCALETARHLLEDLARTMFDTYKIDEDMFDVVTELIKSESLERGLQKKGEKVK